MKSNPAGTQGSEKGAGHEQPKRVRPHRIAACPTAFHGGLLPFLFERERTFGLRRSRNPIGSEAKIFRLSAQKNRARYHHQNPKRKPESQKSAAPAVMGDKEL